MKRFILFLCLLLTAAQAEKTVSLETRVFHTPPDFMRPDEASRFEYRPAQFPELPDPFGQSTATKRSNVRDTARGFLEQHGFFFPKGSAIFYESSTHLLTVRSTPDCLDMMDAYLSELAKQQPCSVSLHFQVLEAPGAILRDLEKQVTINADCGKALASLRARAEKPSSGLRIVTSAHIDALGGHRSVYESIIEHAFCETVHFDMKHRMSVPYARHPVGTIIELEPTVGPDQCTIELNYQIGLHPGLPTGREMAVTDPTTKQKIAFTSSDFLLAHFTSGTTFTDGMTKLVALTKPPVVGAESTQDLLWGIFIAAKIQTTAMEPKKRPQPHTLADGLHSVSRRIRFGSLESDIRQSPFHESPLPEADQKGEVPDFLTRNGIPHVEGSRFKIEHDTLFITNTLENIERIDAMLDEDCGNGPKTNRYVLQIIEMPAKLLREISISAHQHFDHAAEWSRVLQSVAEGNARHLDTAWIEGKTMDTTSLTTGRDHAFLDGLSLTPTGQSDLSIANRLIGTSLTLTPAGDAHLQARSFDYRLETHTAPETIRRLDFHDPASQKKFDLPLTDFHLSRISGRTILHSGCVKLLSTWKPAGRPDLEKKGLEHAAFLRCVETTYLTPPLQKGQKKATFPQDPKAWETRRFKVPPDFLSFGAAGGAALAADPFAAQSRKNLETQNLPIKSDLSRDVLVASGVTFPEGAFAHYDRITSTLTVKNTVENLRLIESYTEELAKQGPKTVVMTSHLLEGPESLILGTIERCLPQNDHRDEMQRLFDLIPKSKVTSRGTLRLETKGGTRATAKQVTERTHITELGVNADGVPHFTVPKRDVGFVLEAEPTVGPDGTTVELGLDLHFDTQPPIEHREHLTDRATGKPIELPLTDFHTTKLQAGLTMLSGSGRLIGVWRGKDKHLQALFITCDVVPAL